MKRETYKNITTNAAQLNAGAIICIEDRNNAEKNNNLPHNSLTVANEDSSCTLYLFLDDMQDQTKPSFILFPLQQITISHEEGISFTHLFIKNTHASANIAANDIKIRISTVKESE